MKKWLKKLLGINELEEKYDKLLKRYNILAEEVVTLESLNKKVIEENNFILKQFNISADIYTHEPISWAVISIQGKPEYVRFISLSHRDMREIHSFLKMFERTNRTIDSPAPYFKF